MGDFTGIWRRVLNRFADILYRGTDAEGKPFEQLVVYDQQ
jgi:hypothetical protein